MIEIRIECLNPGCKIDYKVDEVVINIEETLKIMTDEIIRVMHNRELKAFKVDQDLFAPPTSGLTITTDSEKDTQMDDTILYRTMYSESLTKVKHQRDEIEQLKAKIKVLEAEMKLFKSIMKDEVERLQDLLGGKNEDEKVVN